MSEQSLTSIGYQVVRLLEPPATLSQDLLPDRILTLSSCLTELFPGSWALDWVKCTDEAREAAASRFGIPSVDLPRVCGRVRELFDGGALAWPNVWRRPDVARNVIRELVPESGALALVGVGIRPGFIESLLSELTPRAGEAASGCYLAAIAREPMFPGATLVGWELLLETEAAATDVLRMMEENPEKAEPATWIPAAIFQYAL